MRVRDALGREEPECWPTTLMLAAGAEQKDKGDRREERAAYSATVRKKPCLVRN